MKNIFIILILLPLISKAQFYIDSDTLFISGNTVVYVNDDFYTAQTSVDEPYISLTDSLSVTKDVDLSGSTVLSGNGWLTLCGTDTQHIDPNGIPVKNLVVCNPTAVKLAGDMLVQESLIFSDGSIILGNNDLRLGSAGSDSGRISGYGPDQYIMTNGSGTFSRYTNGTVIFPVGNSSYNPIQVANSGTADDLSVRVEDAIYSDYWPLANIQTVNAVDRAWYVEEGTPGGTNGAVTVYWSAADELSSFNRTSSAIGWYNLTLQKWDKGTVQPATSVGGLYSQSRSNLTTFNTYFGIGGFNSPVPVELLFFEAEWEKSGDIALLKWATASESRNSHFEIERSFDGKNWEYVGKRAGQGTTTQIHHYSFLDILPKSSNSPVYYRLKQVDLNGEFTYSQVRILKSTGSRPAMDALVWPNPAKDQIQVKSGTDIHVSFALINAVGKTLLQDEFTGWETINTGVLANGIYFLKMYFDDGTHHVEKIIIRK